MKKYKRLLAIDPSLTCSGWALFDINLKKLLCVGNIKSVDKGVLSEKLLDLQNKVSILFKALELSKNDVLICEEATSIVDPRATLVVEQVRCIFDVLARSFKACVPGRVNPRTVQYEIMGLKGSQIDRENVKQIARQTVSTLYAKELLNIGFLEKDILKKSNQDIIDAILIGTLALSRIDNALRTNLSLDEVFTSNYRRRRC
ncbi:MAG: hypothetical protein ACOX3T_05620 [Bdellovibrionota bacterium]